MKIRRYTETCAPLSKHTPFLFARIIPNSTYTEFGEKMQKISKNRYTELIALIADRTTATELDKCANIIYLILAIS